MPRRVLDVFLSSTAKDLAEHRVAVHTRLARTGIFHCVRQEDFGAQDAGAIEHCRKEAQRADLFIGLVGLRRGWEPDGDNAKRSITQMEHDWAKEAGCRRFLWVTPDDFPVPGNLRETDAEHTRQQAFRGRVMGTGERIVSQKGFGSPELLASEIVEHLLAQVVTSDLLALLRPEYSSQVSGAEEQVPAIAAAVEKLSSDADVDLLALAKDPKGVDLADLEAKLLARAEAHEAAAKTKAEPELKASAEYWRHIGALAFLHDTQKALAAYEKAVALDPGEPDALTYVGELRYRRGELALARDVFEALLKLGRQQSDKRAESMACLRLGWIHRDRGDLAAAEACQKDALQIAESIAWTEGMARAYGNLGLLNQARGDLDKAEDMHLKALKLEEELNRKEGMARAYGNLGLVHQTRGDLGEAEEMQIMSLKLEEELGNKEGMAITYGNLGVVHQTRGDLFRAEQMQLKALKLSEEVGRKEGMSRAYNNLGIIHQKRGELGEAEEMHLKALKLEEELDRKEGMAAIYGNLGIIQEGRGDMASTCDCWRKARDLYREMGLTKQADEWEAHLRQTGCAGT